MKKEELITYYVKTLRGAPIVSEVPEEEEMFCLYKEIRIMSRAIKHLKAAAERNDACSIWLLTQVYSSLSDMEKVNY